MARKKPQKSGLGNIFIALIATIAIAVGGYYYFSDKENVKQEQTTKSQQQQTTKDTKTQSAQTADYKKQTLKAQANIEKALKAQGLKIQTQKNTEQSIDRDGEKGTINWWQRQTTITLDQKASLQTIKDNLTKALKDQNITIIRTQQDTYNNKQAQRLDLAYTDELGGEPLSLVVDKIYLIFPQTTKAQQTQRLGSGKLAIVIDDCGYDTASVKKMTALKQKLTFAVIPYREYSTQALNIIKNSRQQAILHLPMQPLDKSQQSENITITTDLTDAQIKAITQKAIDQLPGIVGVNNHQGSRATADNKVMKAVLTVVKQNDLYFLDSNTQPNTIAYKLAGQMNIDTGLNKAFLDGQANVEYIKTRMRQAGQAAIKNGSYIAICHARPDTATALVQMVDELEQMGVQFVFASTLLN